MTDVQNGCTLLNSCGRCEKFDSRRKCRPSTRSWFDETIEHFIPFDRVCEESSIFGNDYIMLTDDDLDRLKKGEIAHVSGEYGIFIGYSPAMDKEENDEN